MKVIATTIGAAYVHKGYVVSESGQLGRLATNMRGATITGTFVPISVEGAWEARLDLDVIARLGTGWHGSKGWVVEDGELASRALNIIETQLAPIRERFFDEEGAPKTALYDEYYMKVADTWLEPVIINEA